MKATNVKTELLLELIEAYSFAMGAEGYRLLASRRGPHANPFDRWAAKRLVDRFWVVAAKRGVFKKDVDGETESERMLSAVCRCVLVLFA